MFFWLAILVFDCCAKNYQNFNDLKQYTFMISPFLWERNLTLFRWVLCSWCHLAKRKVSVCGLTCSSRPILSLLVVSRIPALCGHRTKIPAFLHVNQGLFSDVSSHPSLPATWSFAPLLVFSFKTSRRICTVASWLF